MFWIFLLNVFLSLSLSTDAANWAVLVAGSNGWFNYRHQADVCHAYQLLHKFGIPDSNIIVMMYDDIANSRTNPVKGTIINRPNGEDVYKGVPHDYTGKTVTPKNFLNILMGDKEAMKNIGSGKVLESGPDDHVFIFFTDHGAVGLVAFPSGVLHAKDFNSTLNKMYQAKKYKQMVIYIEACESGSMFEHILAENLNIYATTAANAEESSYACYYDDQRMTYLGDVYSVMWMEDSEVEVISKETLYEQFLITKNNTNTSHVMEYGDLTLGKTHYVSEFQSANENIRQLKIDRQRSFPLDAVPSEDVRLAIITRRLINSDENSLEKESLERELNQYLEDRSLITNQINDIVSKTIATRSSNLELSTLINERKKLTDHDCYRSVTDYLHEKCFDLSNELVLKKLYIFVNLCERRFYDIFIRQSIDEVCVERLHLNY